MSIPQIVQQLSPGAIIELIEVDLTGLGDSIYRFHNGTNELNLDVTWQGNIYTRFPIELSGFETNTKGALARPVMKIANVSGLIVPLLKNFGDMVGGKITRKRTMTKYLDAVNFIGGVNADEDQAVYFADDVYYIDRKASENKVLIQFDLVSTLDLQGITLPRRQVIQNSCSWVYRSSECSYSGIAVADINDNPETDLALDVCGKRLESCKLRFGQNSILSYGGFPGSGLLGR